MKFSLSGASRLICVALGTGALCLASVASAQDVLGPGIGPPPGPAAFGVPQPPVTTVWQKLGVPQNYARMRDGLLNRRGNLPFLEKKPPLLKLSDPRNLAAGQPEMIKAAAEIKKAEDMKKQKLKALKYLADINCGCYNKDGKVEGAFLEALDDCDPDVRMAAIEGLSKAAGGNSKCKFCQDRKKLVDCKLTGGGCGSCNGCQTGGSCNECNTCDTGCTTTCCTRKLQDKLEDIVYGMKDGCYKEPVAEIRAAAEKLLQLCPCAPLEPEELILPKPYSREELIRPNQREKLDGPPVEGRKPGTLPTEGDGGTANLSDVTLRQHFYASSRSSVEMQLNDATTAVPSVLSGASRAVPVRAPSMNPENWAYSNPTGVAIANPEMLVSCKAVTYSSALGELLVEMPFTSQLERGWGVVVIDESNRQAAGIVSEVGGRRILITLTDPTAVHPDRGSQIRFGVVAR